MTPAGVIVIDLYHDSGNVTGVNIASSRPDTAAKVFIGKTPGQVLDMIPLLFTVCGNAQAYAALLACRSALGIAVEPEQDKARDLLVQLETLREHAWRILLDWPVFVGFAPDKKALAALLKFDALFKRHLFRHGEAFKLDSCLNIDVAPLSQLIDELETLINESIFNGRLADFKTISSEILLRDWLQQNNALSANLLNFLYNRGWAGAGQNHIACLPELDTEALESELQRQDLTGFSRAPHWQGRCFETTVLNRQLTQPLIADLSGRYGNGLIVRILARLLEVALIPSQLKQFLAQIKDKTILPAINPVKSQIGLAQVQAARGLLIHRLELQRGRVSDYRTVAPTEWNFHPDGVIVQSLKQLQAGNPSDLKRQAELLINAIDPCVQYALNLINSCNEI